MVYMMTKELDCLIREALCAGIPVVAIAGSLNVPVEWVEEYAEYLTPAVAIADLPVTEGMR